MTFPTINCDKTCDNCLERVDKSCEICPKCGYSWEAGEVLEPEDDYDDDRYTRTDINRMNQGEY